MGDVTKLETQKPPEFLVGPFETYKVQIEGRMIPHLTGRREGDRVSLIVDHRFSVSFREEDAYQVAWLLAQALAVGSGYSHLGAETKEQPFAPQGARITLEP